MEFLTYWLSGDLNRDIYGLFFVYIVMPFMALAAVIYAVTVINRWLSK